MRASAVHRRMRARRSRRGVALIMVLLAIMVMTIFLAEVQQDSATALAGAVAAREQLKAEYHARSAINLSRLLIASEPTVRKSVAPILLLLQAGKGKPPQIPVWEFSDQVLGVFNDTIGAEGFGSLAGVDAAAGENLGLGVDGRFDLVIVDEDAKINVNTAARGDIISQTRLASQLLGLLAPPQYNPLFEQTDADGQHTDRLALCGALIDWADFDENLQTCDLLGESPSGGTEDNFYQTIGLSYFRKNAGYDSLEELHLVRGMGDDVWSTFVDPDPQDPRKRIMTVWGQGAINVNTASAQTVLGLICGPAGAPDAELCTDPVQMQTFLATVDLMKSFTAGAPIFGSASDFIKTMKGGGLLGPFLAQVGIKPVTFKSESEMKKMVTTESKVFSIYAEGVVPGALGRETRVSVQAVVDFRSAAELSGQSSALGSLLDLAGGKAKPETEPQEPAEESNADPTQAAIDAIAQSPGGQLLYWRIQ